jgi:hypothetical protein
MKLGGKDSYILERDVNARLYVLVILIAGKRWLYQSS